MDKSRKARNIPQSNPRPTAKAKTSQTRSSPAKALNPLPRPDPEASGLPKTAEQTADQFYRQHTQQTPESIGLTGRHPKK